MHKYAAMIATAMTTSGCTSSARRRGGEPKVDVVAFLQRFEPAWSAELHLVAEHTIGGARLPAGHVRGVVKVRVIVRVLELALELQRFAVTL